MPFSRRDRRLQRCACVVNDIVLYGPTSVFQSIAASMFRQGSILIKNKTIANVLNNAIIYPEVLAFCRAYALRDNV